MVFRMFEHWKGVCASVCVCLYVCDDAGVSVSERCLKGVKIVKRWVLCSQITASDKAWEKHWLHRSLYRLLILDEGTFLSQAEDFPKTGFLPAWLSNHQAYTPINHNINTTMWF